MPWGPAWSSLVLLGLCMCPLGKPVGNGQWAMPNWEVCWWFPRGSHTSLWAGSSWHIGPSIHLKRESPMTITLIFFLIEEVLVCRVGCPPLGNSSNLNGFSSTYSSPWSSDSRVSYLLFKGTWRGEVGQQGIHLPPQAENHFYSPLSLKSSSFSLEWVMVISNMIHLPKAGILVFFYYVGPNSVM